MSVTLKTDTPNLPKNKPVFDFTLEDGSYCRVAMSENSKNIDELVVSVDVFEITSDGQVKLNDGVPFFMAQSTHTIDLGGVLGGTNTLYDGWVKYSGPEAINAKSLPEGWTSGKGEPGKTKSVGGKSMKPKTPEYGTGYYDETNEQGYVYAEGEFQSISRSRASALQELKHSQAKLAELGL